MLLSYVLIVFAVPDGNNICHLIANEAREICSDHIVDEEWTESECISSECCWEQQINSSVPSCYRKGLQLCSLSLLCLKSWILLIGCNVQNGSGDDDDDDDDEDISNQ